MAHCAVSGGDAESGRVAGFHYYFHRSNRAPCASTDCGGASVHSPAVDADGYLHLCSAPSTTLVFRDIPTYLTPQAMCRFLCLDTMGCAASAGDEVQSSHGVLHVALVQTGPPTMATRQHGPSTYALLMRVSRPCDAVRFHSEYHGKVVTALGEAEVLTVSYAEEEACEGVATIVPHQPRFLELARRDTTPADTALPHRDCRRVSPYLSATSPSITCAVCLEVIEPSTAHPVFTSDCVHHLHLLCFLSLPDSHCPLCRHSISDPDTVCFVCARVQREHALHMCLVCGFVGCAPSAAQPTESARDAYHSTQHYLATGHTYAIDVDTQVAWDYAASCPVHRLLARERGSDLVPEFAEEHVRSVEERNRVDRVRVEAERKQREAIAGAYARLLEAQLLQQERYYRLRGQGMIERWMLSTTEHEESSARLAIMCRWVETLLQVVEHALAKPLLRIVDAERQVLQQTKVASDAVRIELEQVTASTAQYRKMLERTVEKRVAWEADSSCPEVTRLQDKLTKLYEEMG